MNRYKKYSTLSTGATTEATGFTLIEVLVVMTILGLLAALIIPNVMGRVDEAKIKDTKIQIRALSTACDMYKLDVGKYPGSLGDLVAGSGQGWNGPYLKGGKVPKDPWGEEYQYSVINNGKDVQISSNGGGEQQISSVETGE